MAKSRRKQAVEETAIDMTPMLDIVFIMLIFFIVTTAFVKQSGVDVSRPIAEEAISKPKANIFVAVTKDDDIWIDRKNVEVEELSISINRLMRESPDGEVIIQADKEAKNGLLVKVMDAVKKSAAKKILISATQG